jgi:FkbM family methyltransferase
MSTFARLAAPVLSLIERKSAYYLGKGYSTPRESYEIAALASLIAPPTVVFDGGANKGEWTAAAKQVWPNAKYHLFEPSSLNVALLKERHPDAVINPVALSDQPGSAVLYANEPGSGIASLHQRRLEHHNLTHEAIEETPLITLDEYCAAHGIAAVDVIKLDIEGHELAALRGAQSILSKTKAVQFEFGGCNIDSRVFLQDFWYLFRDAGFALYRITPFGPLPVPAYRETDEAFVISNYIALNRAAA